MPTKALNTKSTAKVSRALSTESSCPVTKILREVAACRRLLRSPNLSGKLEELSRSDRSELTEEYAQRLLLRRIRALDSLACQLQPTSRLGAAYQVLLAVNLTALDDHIDAACDPKRGGAVDRLRGEVNVLQNNLVSAYLALRAGVRDCDLTEVERPYELAEWKPNRTITALLASEPHGME